MKFEDVDFNLAPFLLIWETTQACALACKHCRAEAMDFRHPKELTFQEGKQLILDVARMKTPVLVFSGGDPLRREDLEDLIRFAKDQNLRTGTIPAATPRLTQERVFKLKQAGLDQIAFSLDGWDEASHDTFRGIKGAFQKTMQGIDFAHRAQIPLQINTCFGKWNQDHFDEIADLVESFGIVFWEIFFLVPTGRGNALQGMEAERIEGLFEKIYQRAKRASYIIKVTEAPHYRRFVLQQEQAKRLTREDPSTHVGRHEATQDRAIHMARQAVNSGKGFCFVSHTGEVYPSGFLPISAGNVRQTSVVDLYRHSELFKHLRLPYLLKGRCGQCEYRQLCGGSRSRAHALTGDYLAEEPFCSYQPHSSHFSVSIKN